MLKTKNPEEINFDAVDAWTEILASMGYFVRSSYHSTLQAPQGQIGFGRNALLNLKFEPDFQQSCWQQKQARLRQHSREWHARPQRS